ncbi:MAG: hypothetical protein HKM05_04965 [Spirochaetales bacterium]|nr:hypothetical protein [Spirochaetales bacterium]
MKKSLGILLLLVFSVTFSYAQEAQKVPEGLKKASEIDTNFVGLFLGYYTLRFETNLATDGFTSVGIKASFNSNTVSGTSLTDTGYSLIGDLRLYPARYRNGFYLLVETGYVGSTISDSTGSVTLGSIPFEGGLGYKWNIGQFDIDLNFAAGKQVYVNQPASNIVDLNSWPFNLALDGGLLVGYRF